MDENELKVLQSQLAGEGGQAGGATDKEQEEKRAAEAVIKRDMLAAVLDNGARERLSRIALVAPQRSAQIEAMLLQMAQRGQLRGRVTEQMLIGLLEQAEGGSSKQGAKKGAIVYQRRKDIDEDDFDI